VRACCMHPHEVTLHRTFCNETNVNVDDVFYCKNVIKHSQVFQLNFANVIVVPGRDKMVPSIDSKFADIVLCYGTFVIIMNCKLLFQNFSNVK